MFVLEGIIHNPFLALAVSEIYPNFSPCTMFAIIDIETTGGSAERDKITEIAIILHDGHREEHRFATLLNPEMRIPRYITDITGITDDMVADAPRFYEVAKEIVELTEDRIFVAHNVNFDYGFIREEFKRLGYTFKRNLLCTVRTSRSLIPGHPTYSLGKFCAALGIPLRDRHRAMGDAEATALLLERLVQIQPSLAMKKVVKDPYAGFPETISRSTLAKLPDDPGVYFLHDSSGSILASKAVSSIRGEVFKLFQKKKQAPVEVSDITWECSGTEWMAGLQWLARVGETAAKAKSAEKFEVVAYKDQLDYLRLAVLPKSNHPDAVARFATVEDAKAAVSARMIRYHLCGALCGVEPLKNGHCSRYPAGGCEGACAGKEDAAAYNLRVVAALNGLGFPHGRFLVVDRGRSLEESSVVLIENGCCLRFGFLDASQSWADAEGLADALEIYPHPKAGGEWMRKALKGIKPQQIRPI